VGLLKFMKDNGRSRLESSDQADTAWRERVDQYTETTLFGRADSWYMAANVPGKARQMINCPCGIPDYLAQWHEAKQAGYAGFDIR